MVKISSSSQQVTSPPFSCSDQPSWISSCSFVLVSNPIEDPMDFTSQRYSKSAHISPSLLLTPWSTLHHILPGLLQQPPTLSPHFTFHPPLTYAPQGQEEEWNVNWVKLYLYFEFLSSSPLNLKCTPTVASRPCVMWFPHFSALISNRSSLMDLHINHSRLVFWFFDPTKLLHISGSVHILSFLPKTFFSPLELLPF